MQSFSYRKKTAHKQKNTTFLFPCGSTSFTFHLTFVINAMIHSITYRFVYLILFKKCCGRKEKKLFTSNRLRRFDSIIMN